MVRSTSAFSWQNGNVPECKIHSRIKLDILRSYLLSYFPTIAGDPRLDYVNIHLVDAFCGGGIFRESQFGHPILGSPMVMLQAVQEAEQAIAAGKTKPFQINAKYHFADKCKHAVNRLRETISDSGFGDRLLTGEVKVDHLRFDLYLPKILERIPSKKRTKAIFFLDQTGWNHATLSHCNQILSHLPKAEIIWNISVESLATYANDQSDFRTAVKRFGVDLGDAFTSMPRFNHYSDWRKALVAVFLQQIQKECHAKYISPFMIQHDGWGYWLLHLSNHHEANDVMKATHWRHQNSSLHEGFPGLRMLEFNRENWGQATMWRFDEDARLATQEALVEQLGPRIRELGSSPTIHQLTESIANETPADRTRLYHAIDTLRAHKELVIVGPNEERRRNQPQSLDDRLVLSKQLRLI